MIQYARKSTHIYDIQGIRLKLWFMLNPMYNWNDATKEKRN